MDQIKQILTNNLNFQQSEKIHIVLETIWINSDCLVWRKFPFYCSPSIALIFFGWKKNPIEGPASVRRMKWQRCRPFKFLHSANWGGTAISFQEFSLDNHQVRMTSKKASCSYLVFNSFYKKWASNEKSWHKTLTLFKY